MNILEFMCFDLAGNLIASADYKKNAIIATSAKSFNKIYSKLYKAAKLGVWEVTKCTVFNSQINKDNELYLMITNIIYKLSIDISLNKTTLKKEYISTKQKIKDITTELINKEKIEENKLYIMYKLNEALLIPDFFYYAIDVFSINQIIASKSLITMVEDDFLRNKVIIWLNLLGRYVINISNAEFIISSTCEFYLIARANIKKNDVLVFIWKNNKGLIDNDIVWPEFDCDDDVIFIINLILKYHTNLGKNKYIKHIFDRVIEIDKMSCDLRPLIFPISHLAPPIC